MSNAVDDNPIEEDGYDGTEMILINPRKDIWTYQIPLGLKDVEEYKKAAAESLAKKLVDTIEPEFMEMPGFELMYYKVIIKKYEH